MVFWTKPQDKLKKSENTKMLKQTEKEQTSTSDFFF